MIGKSAYTWNSWVCEYWNNDEVRFMIEGTDSSIHDFDGCCYGLGQKFGDSNKYIKKPWRIVSWNVEVGSQLSLRCDGRHEHVPCAGRETLHTQLYTSKIVSIILEESNKRFHGIEAQSDDACTAGSSGNGNKKKKHIALSCIGRRSSKSEANHEEYLTCSVTFRIVGMKLRTSVPINKILSKPKLRWTRSPLLKHGGNPKRGVSSSGAAGAGCATRSDGHKSCPDAMADASGSGSRPRRGAEKTDDRPPLFARDDTNATRYMRETGAMLMSLMEDEQNGVIVLPAKIEGQPNHMTIAESWVPFGIPFAIIIGLVLSNVVTNKANLQENDEEY